MNQTRTLINICSNKVSVNHRHIILLYAYGVNIDTRFFKVTITELQLWSDTGLEF